MKPPPSSPSSSPPQPSPEALRALASLREAVHDAFEKKRRMGQYAVVWRDGEIHTLRGAELNSELSSSKETPSG